MRIVQHILGFFYWLCGAITGCTQVNPADVDENYTVNRLWPGENGDVEPNSKTLTLIFFHGLQLTDGTRPWWTTWTVRDTDECWPQKWLPEDLQKKGIENLRVLSLSYDSIASRWGDRGRTRNVSQIGKDLVQNLICNPEWKLDKDQRIVLVGHSFGGLVIKSMIAEVFNRLVKSGTVPGTSTTAPGSTETMRFTERMDCECREFLNHIQHIIFYAVPHLGTDVAKYMVALNSVFSLRLAGIVKNLEPFQMEMTKLSKDFELAISYQRHRIPIFAFAETQKYRKVLVVPEASAIHLANENMPLLDADHVNICKPKNKKDPGYQKVVRILEFVMKPQGDADDCSNRVYGTPRASLDGSDTQYTTPRSSLDWSDTKMQPQDLFDP